MAKNTKVGEGLNLGERVGILLGNYSSSPNSNWEINQEKYIWWNNSQLMREAKHILKITSGIMSHLLGHLQNKFLLM